MTNNMRISNPDGSGFSKSSYSGSGDQCLEARKTVGGAEIRDSKNKKQPALRLVPGDVATVLAFARKHGTTGPTT